MSDDAFYVQHITGYNHTEANYKALSAIYRKAGFVRLRSRPALDKSEVEMAKEGRYFENGKKMAIVDLKKTCYEIWYLPGPFAAEGPIADAARQSKSKAVQTILNWLANKMGPGEITCRGEHWGLGID